jgi:hypothetical protein
MLGKVVALEYVRQTGAGRTCPLMVNCEKPDGSVISAVAKFSDFCDQRETHLARQCVLGRRPGFAGTGTYDHRNPGRLERYRPGPAFAGAGGSKQPNSPSHNRGCYLPKRSIFTESSHHFHMLVG